MARFSAQTVAVLIIGLAGAHGFHWFSSLPDGGVKYLCVGDDLRFPWNYTTSSGDVILSVRWFFQGQSQQLLAFQSNGSFALTPSFSNRLRHVGYAALLLSHVTKADTGSYSVEVSGHSSNGTYFNTRQTMTVQVMDNMFRTTNGALHAMLDHRAIYSNRTGQWSLVVSCGNFTFPDDPPLDVEWVTPSSMVPLQKSDDYKDGYFQLHVTSGGDYTCTIPQHAAAGFCPGQYTQHATVHVDKMEARMILLEARQRQLEAENKQLRDRDARLTQSLLAVTDRVVQQVAFSALLSAPHNGSGPMVFGVVLTNYGDAYKSSTGRFTAPVSGLYFFLLDARPHDKDAYPDARIVKEGSAICSINSPTGVSGTVASCGVAVHLTAGQSVWATSRYLLSSGFTHFHRLLDCGGLRFVFPVTVHVK